MPTNPAYDAAALWGLKKLTPEEAAMVKPGDTLVYFGTVCRVRYVRPDGRHVFLDSKNTSYAAALLSQCALPPASISA